MPETTTATTATKTCGTCHNVLVRAHVGEDVLLEVTFLGRLNVTKSGSTVACRRCKSVEPITGELAKALAGAVLVPVRAREGA